MESRDGRSDYAAIQRIELARGKKSMQEGASKRTRLAAACGCARARNDFQAQRSERLSHFCRSHGRASQGTGANCFDGKWRTQIPYDANSIGTAPSRKARRLFGVSTNA